MDPDLERLTADRVFCLYPWINLHVRPDGCLPPCCAAEGNDWDRLNESARSIDELWNGEKLRSFRRGLLKGIPDPRCSYCYTMDQAKNKSLRTIINTQYSRCIEPYLRYTDKTGRSPIKPMLWDLRFSNKCNHACRMCNSLSSSRWVEEERLLNPGTATGSRVLQVKDSGRWIDSIVESYSDALVYLYFAGGEQLIMEEHYRILGALIDRKKTDIHVVYNTNLSTLSYKGIDVVSLWNQFRAVSVDASLDDSHERGDLIRKGQDWNRVLGNRLAIRERAGSNVVFGLNITTSVLNVFHVLDFVEEWVQKGLVDLDHVGFYNVLASPSYLSVKILPRTLKARVEAIFASKFNGRFYDEIVPFMNSEDLTDQIPAFIENTKALDRLRGEDTFRTIPELQPLLGHSRGLRIGRAPGDVTVHAPADRHVSSGPGRGSGQR